MIYLESTKHSKYKTPLHKNYENTNNTNVLENDYELKCTIEITVKYFQCCWTCLIEVSITKMES